MTIAINQRLKNLDMPTINHKKLERLIIKLGIQARPKQKNTSHIKVILARLVQMFWIEISLRKCHIKKMGTDVTVFIMPFEKTLSILDYWFPYNRDSYVLQYLNIQILEK